MSPRIEIPPFPEGKRIAVTISFDDGHSFDKKIVEKFNEWGLKATFFLFTGPLQNTGKPSNPEERVFLDCSEIAEVYRGHEVGIHSVTHPHLPLLSPAQVADEVLECRKALEDLVGYPVRGMAYPYGTFNQPVIELLRALGIAYSRTTIKESPCFPAKEPLALGVTTHQYATNPTVPELFQQLYDNPKYSGVFYPWGHGFEFHDKNDWDSLERIYEPLSGKPDVWYCTNLELVDYEEARKRMIIAANRKTAYNPSAIAVTLRVDGKLIAVPGGAKSVISNQ